MPLASTVLQERCCLPPLPSTPLLVHDDDADRDGGGPTVYLNFSGGALFVLLKNGDEGDYTINSVGCGDLNGSIVVVVVFFVTTNVCKTGTLQPKKKDEMKAKCGKKGLR